MAERQLDLARVCKSVFHRFSRIMDENKNMLKHEDEDKPGLLEALATKWKTTSGAKKVMWLAIALLAVYLVYQFKKNWDETRAEQKRNSNN
jgi:hypothetical protein